MRGAVKRLVFGISAVLGMLAILLVVGLLAMPAEAHHRDGHDKGGKPIPTLDASFRVTPNPATAFSVISVTGFDFEPGQEVQIILQPVWCCVWGRFTPDINGEFSFITRTSNAGTYKLCGLVDFEDAKGPKRDTACAGKSKGTLVAFTEFEVRE